MNKIITIFIALCSFQMGYAQSDCATAQPITTGLTSVATLTGAAPTTSCDEDDPATLGAWFSYTAATTGVVTVSSDLPVNSGRDTNLAVYSGTCDSLLCVVAEDDVDLAGSNYLSTVEFLAIAGVTYYIAWDDRWEADAFSFEVSIEFPVCGTTTPYAQTFDDNAEFLYCYTVEDVDGDGSSWITQQNLDLDGDSINETFATNANSSNLKNDWLFSAGFNLVGGTAYSITTTFNVFGATQPNTASLEAFITNTPSSNAATQIPLFSHTGITSQGEFATLESSAYEIERTFTPPTTGIYHIAYRSFGSGSSGFVLLFDSNIDTALSVDQQKSNTIKHYYDKDSDVLTLTSTKLELSNIQIFNLLGQEVMEQKLSQTTDTVNLGGLLDGILFINLNVSGKIETFKIVKW